TEAMTMSDRVIIFNKGVIQQIDTPINIYKNPANEFVRDFIGRINFINGTVNDGKIIFSDNQFITYSGNKSGDVLVAIRTDSDGYIVF
ncbi:MAG: ABC transporter ATP-binding protein, partial [Synergistaceae bacterium]|nr:ABC transporter ATP-binding protein [Synergistaceae bacterium]